MRVNNKISVGAIIFLVFSGLVYGLFGQSAERLVWVLSVIVAVFSINGVSKKIIINKDSITFTYIVFIGSFLVDCVYGFNLRPLVYGIGMLVTYLIGKVLVGEQTSEKIYRYISITIILFSVAVIALSVLLKGITFNSYIGYTGLFENPNTFGIFVESLFTVIISIDLAKTIDDDSLPFYNLVILAVLIIFTIISSCRIAILAMMVQTLIFLIKAVFKKKTSFNNIIRILLYIAIGALIFGFLCIEFNIIGIFQTTFINKFTTLRGRGDVSNGRFNIWRSIWNESKILGTGDKVFIDASGLESHNVYLGLMDQYGKLNAFAFLAFVITTLCKSVGLSFDKKCTSKWRFLPLMATLCFLFVSMSENYLMTTPMILMFTSIPLLTNNDFEDSVR